VVEQTDEVVRDGEVGTKRVCKARGEEDEPSGEASGVDTIGRERWRASKVQERSPDGLHVLCARAGRHGPGDEPDSEGEAKFTRGALQGSF
jgi:hypothetical protein